MPIAAEFTSSLPTPVTIGREEGNTVQLNDERISRFHIKIQEDQGKLVLTDLESTNGTRVNGEDVQLRILRFGDVISVGRSVLLYGTRDQIVGRLDELRDNGLAMTGELDAEKMSQQLDPDAADFEVRWGASENLHSTLHIPAPPDLPAGLSPGQAAQLSEIFEYLHLQSRTLVQGVTLPEGATHAKLDLPHWQELLDLQGQAGRVSAQDRRAGGGITAAISSALRLCKMRRLRAIVCCN